MSAATGKPLVVYFGMMGYKVLSEHETEEEAAVALAEWQAYADDPTPLALPGWTRDAYAHDFDVRTQADLDALTRAILDSYR